MKLISDAIAAKKWAPQIYQHRPARWWCDQWTPIVVNRRVKRKLAVACGAARGSSVGRSDNGQLTVLCDTDRLTTVREEESDRSQPDDQDDDAETNRRPQQTCESNKQRLE
ncbi:Testis-specific Y-encoded protein [Trichinella pseudospiralis]